MSVPQLSFVLVLAILALPPTDATEPRPTVQPAQKIGKPIDRDPKIFRLDVVPDADGFLAIHRDVIDDATFVRLQLIVDAPTTIDTLAVRVKATTNGTSETIDLKGTEGKREIWTLLIPGYKYRLDVIGGTQPPGTTLTIQTTVRNAEFLGMESTVGALDLEQLKAAPDEALRKAGRATALLIYEQGMIHRVCTAFLIGPSRMVSNRHCLSSQRACNNAVVAFDFDEGLTVPFDRQRRCSLLKSDDATDFAVFELQAPADPTIAPLRFSSATPAAGTKLVVIQHPNGEPKKYVRKECAVVKSKVKGYGAETDFTHSCDTADGSSGAAVMTEDFMVVGLHHLARGGSQPEYNRAVRVEALLQQLRAWGMGGRSPPTTVSESE